MRILVIGYGSIGRRHAGNILKRFPDVKLAVTDPDASRLQTLPAHVFATTDTKAAWDFEPQIVFVCSPTHLHLQQATMAVNRGCHVFIEKPISHTLEGVKEFVALCKSKGAITQVGANMRYHAGPRKLKELQDRGVIGRLISVDTYYGGYLPDWHPWEDYRKTYSASIESGGGVLTDIIHEIDTALWYLDEPVVVTGLAAHTGLLEICAEDLACVVIRDKNQAIGNVHLDYLQKPTRRFYTLVGEHGRLEWDIDRSTVNFFKRDGTVENYALDDSGQRADANSAYIHQLEDFIQCIEKGKNPLVSCVEASAALEIASIVRNCLGQEISRWR